MVKRYAQVIEIVKKGRVRKLDKLVSQFYNPLGYYLARRDPFEKRPRAMLEDSPLLMTIS